MKKNAIKLISLLFLTFAAASVSVHAQTEVRYKARIAFDFHIGDTSFKAGTYTIGAASPASSNGLLKISDSTGRVSKIVMSRPGEKYKTTGAMVLMFNIYSGQHYLADIATPTLNAKFSLSSAMREVAKEQPMKSETVSLKK